MNQREIHRAALKKLGGILATIVVVGLLSTGLVCGVDWLSDHAEWALWVIAGLTVLGVLYEMCRGSVEAELKAKEQAALEKAEQESHVKVVLHANGDWK